MPTTGEDETKDGKLLARQNVVHEAGLFQGKLGFTRAIILLEEVTEGFSNLAGLKRKRAIRVWKNSRMVLRHRKQPPGGIAEPRAQLNPSAMNLE